MWPTRDQVDGAMPSTFKKEYPSLIAQSALYSNYKQHVTYKGLVGIAPSGAVKFISQLFDGSNSDKEIVRRKELWSPGDSVMADKGFTIEDDLASLNVTLEIQKIAAVRIHIERAIQRGLKSYVMR